MRLSKRIIVITASLALASAIPAPCDEYFSSRGFSIDLPEGFEYLEGNGSTQFSFGFPDRSVKVDIIVYPSSRFDTARSGGADISRTLSGRGDFVPFELGGRDAALGDLRFTVGSGQYRGYCLTVNDAQSPDAGAGSGSGAGAGRSPGAGSYDLAVLVYSAQADYEDYRDIIASAMDGFSINSSRRAVPGPLGMAARAALKPGRPGLALVKFGAATIRAEWNPQEAAVAQALVEREFRILSAYAESPALVDKAMARFYRMVFRDSAPALDRLAFELSAAWETGAWSGTQPAPASPPGLDSGIPGTGVPGTGVPGTGGPRFGAAADPRGYAGALLAWVQGFRYERDFKGSDVVNPISAAFEARGDCDSRALVMALLLRREGIKSILMVSFKHQHALLAVDAPGPGARFPFKEAQWLVAETTARVGIGLVDSGQADPAHWIGVALPD